MEWKYRAEIRWSHRDSRDGKIVKISGTHKKYIKIYKFYKNDTTKHWGNKKHKKK